MTAKEFFQYLDNCDIPDGPKITLTSSKIQELRLKKSLLMEELEDSEIDEKFLKLGRIEFMLKQLEKYLISLTKNTLES